MLHSIISSQLSKYHSVFAIFLKMFVAFNKKRMDQSLNLFHAINTSKTTYQGSTHNQDTTAPPYINKDNLKSPSSTGPNNAD